MNEKKEAQVKIFILIWILLMVIVGLLFYIFKPIIAYGFIIGCVYTFATMIIAGVLTVEYILPDKKRKKKWKDC